MYFRKNSRRVVSYLKIFALVLAVLTVGLLNGTTSILADEEWECHDITVRVQLFEYQKVGGAFSKPLGHGAKISVWHYEEGKQVQYETNYNGEVIASVKACCEKGGGYIGALLAAEPYVTATVRDVPGARQWTVRDSSKVILPGLGELLIKKSVDVRSFPVGVFYEENFSDPNSGWRVFQDDRARGYYKNGEYHLKIWKSGWYYWSCVPGQRSFSNFTAEVDVRQISPQGANTHGFFLRRKGQGDAYLYDFSITGDGRYQFAKRVGGQFKRVLPLTRSSYINVGQRKNHLKVVAKGDRFKLYVNGHHLETITDHSIQSGEICLFLAANSDEWAEVAFDNLKISQGG